MNTELKLKLLQYLNQKKRASGFTFFELMAVIVLLGLVVVAGVYYSPEVQGRIRRARYFESRNSVGIINKGQQAYYAEKSQFSTNIPDLGVGIRTASIYHTKVINSGNKAVAIGYSTINPAGAALKNYVGYVSLIPVGGNSTEVISVGILCEQKTARTLSLDIEWKPGIEPPKCNKYQIQVGGT